MSYTPKKEFTKPYLVIMGEWKNHWFKVLGTLTLAISLNACILILIGVNMLWKLVFVKTTRRHLAIVSEKMAITFFIQWRKQASIAYML